MGYSDTMIRVHHLNNSRSQRVLWLLEELELEYEVVRYERDPATLLAPPSLLAVHPLGKSPVLTDDSTTVAESGAIIEYLLERYGEGRLRPPRGTPEWLRYTYFLHYAEGSAMPVLLLKLVFSRIPRGPMPFVMRPFAKLLTAAVLRKLVDPQLDRHVRYLEGELGRSGWFAGEDFSAADVQMSFVVEAVVARGAAPGTTPRLATFLERIHARPAYQRALTRGGPLSVAS
jgi:glutathione S-transferase